MIERSGEKSTCLKRAPIQRDLVIPSYSGKVYHMDRLKGPDMAIFALPGISNYSFAVARDLKIR